MREIEVKALLEALYESECILFPKINKNPLISPCYIRIKNLTYRTPYPFLISTALFYYVRRPLNKSLDYSLLKVRRFRVYRALTEVLQRELIRNSYPFR